MEDKRYIIKIDRRTEYKVIEHQLYKPKWLAYFGGIEGVREFIKNYDNEK
jgi:hypothetical protein